MFPCSSYPLFNLEALSYSKYLSTSLSTKKSRIKALVAAERINSWYLLQVFESNVFKDYYHILTRINLDSCKHCSFIALPIATFKLIFCLKTDHLVIIDSCVERVIDVWLKWTIETIFAFL